MEDYISNSHKSKKLPDIQKDRRVDKVVTGSARVKKKTELSKFMESVIADDVDNVKDYVVMDVFVPSIKRAISEITSSIFNILSDGVEVLLYGKLGASDLRRPRSASIISRQPYGKAFDRGNRSIRREPVKPSGFEYNDIILDNRGEAEKVLVSLEEQIDAYGMVSVQELYDFAGISGPGGYTKNYYGWTDVSKATISRQRDGSYLLSMPRAMPFD